MCANKRNAICFHIFLFVRRREEKKRKRKEIKQREEKKKLHTFGVLYQKKEGKREKTKLRKTKRPPFSFGGRFFVLTNRMETFVYVFPPSL
jgi:hypothetical protein